MPWCWMDVNPTPGDRWKCPRGRSPPHTHLMPFCLQWFCVVFLPPCKYAAEWYYFCLYELTCSYYVCTYGVIFVDCNLHFFLLILLFFMCTVCMIFILIITITFLVKLATSFYACNIFVFWTRTWALQKRMNRSRDGVCWALTWSEGTLH